LRPGALLIKEGDVALKPDQQIHLVKEAPAAALRDLEDDDLITLIKSDHKEAFEVLVRRHQRLVLGMATRFLADPALGRDVAQDVFLAVWAERSRYQPRGRFVSYLVSVAINRCRYVARQRGSHTRKVTNLSKESVTKSEESRIPLEQLLEQERARDIRSKLTRLPEKMRKVLILRYTNEMSIEEIALATGEPVGTVKSHLFRGVKRLHKLYRKEPS
jgi:RNA polymerase sigma factor (sigma-70 family)